MQSHHQLVALALTIIATAFPGPPAGAEPKAAATPAPDDNALLSGPALVQKLTNSATRASAFYELWRRSHRDKDTGYEQFLLRHYEPDVVVCPQGEGQAPLYVVLYGFLSRMTTRTGDDYPVARPSELFPPVRGPGGPLSWTEPAIAVFTADGRIIEPFSGDDVLDQPGVITDINSDGLVERVSHTSYAVYGVKNVDVLHISAVKPVAQLLLSVLYNWGENEWGYQLADPDRDGILDVQLGPKVAGGIRAEVVYSWDRSRRIYSGPPGQTGEHVRVLAGGQLWDQFKQLKRDGLTFPAYPLARTAAVTCNYEERAWVRRGLPVPSPRDTSRPYRYTSLQPLSREELLRYMGDGQTLADLAQQMAIQSHVPSNFWGLDAKSAALALVEDNRYPDHRNRVRLAVDDRDGQHPPDVCTLAITLASDRSYHAVDRHIYLRVDPKKSYLAYARSWSGGLVFYNFIHDQPTFDFRYCQLAYAQARHIAHTIWWLNRVRSLTLPASTSFAHSFSSADGLSHLAFSADDNCAGIQIKNRTWAEPLADRWEGEYTPEVCLNFSAFLLAEALPAQLGDRWSRLATCPDRLGMPEDRPPYGPDELKRLRATTATFLALFSPDQTAISPAIVAAATRAAGALVFTDLAAELAHIRSLLPRIGTVQDKDLRDALALALRQIDRADDPPALQRWACTREPGGQWALQRLRGLDRERYVAALEWWLKNTKETWARQAFDAIAGVDAQRAVELARNVPPDQPGDLSVSAFSRLTAVEGFPDEQKRIGALIQMALNPQSGWEERGRAVELLVPPRQPWRYPGREVDEALVKLLRPELADDTVNFTLGRASRALARRGRTEHFDRIAATLATAEAGLVASDLLGALSHLAQQDRAACQPRLQALLKPQLRRTNWMMTDILLAIWAADLRGLQPEVENMATSGPDDYEDRMAYSSGGEVRAVEGRFHLARQIAALWREEEPLTRCLLLLAFGLESDEDYVEEPHPERCARMKTELAEAARALTPAQRREALGFLEWYRQTHLDTEPEPIRRERLAKFIILAQSRLTPPP